MFSVCRCLCSAFGFDVVASFYGDHVRYCRTTAVMLKSWEGRGRSDFDNGAIVAEIVLSLLVIFILLVARTSYMSVPWLDVTEL